VIQAYEQLEKALHEELEVRPSPQTIELYENLTREKRTLRQRI
jgi:DNA-binding SARP family transcriptional activator